jgi:glycosyltransferase involved in cell wall biosynthesis
MKPKVSVIIPLYNQKKYIGEAIKSVLDQTYSNIEIIVVNDGSTDDPFPVIQKFVKRIRLINQKNCGLAEARNTGIKAAEGEYIQFLDADDLLQKNKLSRQIEFSLKQNADITYCEIDWLFDDSKRIVSMNIGKIDDIFPYYYNFWLPYPTPIHSLLFNRNIFKHFGLFKAELRANEDRYMLSILAANGVTFKYFPFIGGIYRIHDRSMNADRILMIASAIDYYKKLNCELGDNCIIEKMNYSGYQMMCANLTFLYFQEIQKGTTRELLRQIRQIIKRESLELYANPIPSRFKKTKLPKMLTASYIRRWLKLFNIDI